MYSHFAQDFDCLIPLCFCVNFIDFLSAQSSFQSEKNKTHCNNSMLINYLALVDGRAGPLFRHAQLA